MSLGLIEICQKQCLKRKQKEGLTKNRNKDIPIFYSEIENAFLETI